MNNKRFFSKPLALGLAVIMMFLSVTYKADASTAFQQPIINNVVILSDSITVEWGNVNGATGYDIEVDGVIIDNGLNTIYQHTGLLIGTTYTYKVRAKNDTETGDWSESVTATTVDTISPIITLNGETETTLEVFSAYTEQGATALDDLDGDITANIITTGTVDTSVLGNYIITYEVSDTAGNNATEARTINVVDTTKPVITLNGNNTINLNIGDTYTEEGAVATDNYDGDITSNIVITGTVDTLTEGTYSCRYNVTDNSGNIADEIVRTVNVTNVTPIDTVPPVITLNGETEITLEVFSTYTEEGAAALDDVDGDITADIITTGNVDTSILGEYIITYEVSDNAVNSTSVIRTINVVDTTKPLITLNGNNTINLNIGDTYTEEGAVATDNYDGDITSNIVITGTVDTLLEGTYPVRYNVTDSSGNIADEIIRTVNVTNATPIDTTPPVITLNGETEITLEVFSTYTEQGATALDDVDGDITSNIITTGTVDISVLGDYTITYEVSDTAGNNTIEARTINVVDKTKPVITIIGSSAMELNLGDTYTEEGAMASDNYDGDISNNIVLTGIVDTATEGAYTVSYSVTDSSGNTADKVVRMINVIDLNNIDLVPPVITLNGDSEISLEVFSLYIEEGAVAADDVDGDITANIITTGTVDTDILGDYTITYEVSDIAGNITNATRTIHVVDTTRVER